jgi:hypothetical protein
MSNWRDEFAFNNNGEQKAKKKCILIDIFFS